MTQKNIVTVKSHKRGKIEVSSHTRSAPGNGSKPKESSSTTKEKGTISTFKEVKKTMNLKHPIRNSGIAPLDNITLRKIPVVGKYLAAYNVGHTVGKNVAAAKITYDIKKKK